jgi:lambda family phage portal protein
MWSPLRSLGRWLAGDAAKDAAPAKSTRGRAVGPMRSTFDAAQTGSQNRNHWAGADDLSPNLSNSLDVRRTLRRRARYERDNDPYVDGGTKTLAYDLIGTGPRLQLIVPLELHDAAKQVMTSFRSWMRATNMVEKLRLLAEPRPIDGEVFGQFIENPEVNHPVKLDLRVIETEQVATPNFAAGFDPLAVDGIEFDQFGNPTFYHVLNEHPGDGIPGFTDSDFTRVPAAFMVHWFRPRRPSQPRASSEFASALPIGSQTRRYSAAVLSAAESAASISGVLKTNAPVVDPTDSPFEAGEEVDLPKNTFLSLPEGWDATAFNGTQPTSTHKEFVQLKRAEMFRGTCLPRNRATNDSSEFNFASGKLDNAPYYSVVWIERERFRQLVLDKLYRAWLAEARAVGNIIPPELGDVEALEHDWQWDGFPSIEPLKEALASEKRLQLGVTTLAIECAAEGLDWRDVIDQRAIEREYMRAKGIDPDTAVGIGKAPAAPGSPADPNAPTDTGGGTGDSGFNNSALDDTDLEPRRRKAVVHV